MSRPLIWRPFRPSTATSRHSASTAAATASRSSSRILDGATEHLSEHGTLVVEAGEPPRPLEARYPRLPFVWLEFERGGEGVFLLDVQDLQQCFPGGNSQ